MTENIQVPWPNTPDEYTLADVIGKYLFHYNVRHVKLCILVSTVIFFGYCQCHLCDVVRNPVSIFTLHAIQPVFFKVNTILTKHES